MGSDAKVLGLNCLIHAISPWDVNQDAAHVAMILDIEKAAKIRTEDSVNRDAQCVESETGLVFPPP